MTFARVRGARVGTLGNVTVTRVFCSRCGMRLDQKGKNKRRYSLCIDCIAVEPSWKAFCKISD